MNFRHHHHPATQRNSRPTSKVNFEDEDEHSVNEDLGSFETKIRRKDSLRPLQKYPNIELKRCFDATNFRESNRQITRLASTRAGTMRSLVKTSVPRKYRLETEYS
jgi:hypothetical protein